METACNPIVTKPKPKVEPPKDEKKEGEEAKKEGEGGETPAAAGGEGEKMEEDVKPTPEADKGAAVDTEASKAGDEDMDLD